MAQVTIEDVAKAAGVSTFTVSRALRGMDHVVLNEVLSITAQEWPHSNSAYRLAQSRGLRELAVVTHLNNHHLRCKHI